MEYNIRPQLQPELKLNELEERDNLVQIQVSSAASPDDYQNTTENNRNLAKGIGLNIYVDEKNETKYIGKEIADELKLSDLMNPTIRQYELFYKVTDEMISKIIEYYEIKDKIKITIEYKKLPPKYTYSNENFVRDINDEKNINKTK